MTLKSDVAPLTSDVTCIIAVAFSSPKIRIAVMRRSQKKSKNSASKNSFPNKFHFDCESEQNCQHAFVTHGLKEFPTMHT